MKKSKLPNHVANIFNPDWKRLYDIYYNQQCVLAYTSKYVKREEWSSWMALVILGGSDDCLTTPFLTPVPDCWENMCHELIAKQMLSRKQPGAVRQNMLKNRKTLFFSSFVWHLDTRTFNTCVSLMFSLSPSNFHFGLWEACICRFDSPVLDFHRYFSLCSLKCGCWPWGWSSQSVL